MLLQKETEKKANEARQKKNALYHVIRETQLKIISPVLGKRGWSANEYMENSVPSKTMSVNQNITLENNLIIPWIITHRVIIWHHNSTPILGIHPREIKIQVYKKTGMWMSATTLLIISKDVGTSNSLMNE